MDYLQGLGRITDEQLAVWRNREGDELTDPEASVWGTVPSSESTSGMCRNPSSFTRTFCKGRAPTALETREGDPVSVPRGLRTA